MEHTRADGFTWLKTPKLQVLAMMGALAQEQQESYAAAIDWYR
jgi:hypothetical protein